MHQVAAMKKFVCKASADEEAPQNIQFQWDSMRQPASNIISELRNCCRASLPDFKAL
jgi:hypothetical protein